VHSVSAGTTKASAAWSPSGFLLTGEDGGAGLWATRWDISRGVLTEERTIIDRLGDFPNLSRDGSLVYLRRPRGSDQLVLVGRAGRVQEEFGQAIPAVGALSVSPDGSRVALESEGRVWIHDLNSGNVTRLMNDLTQAHTPRWSRDGKRLGFVGFQGSSRTAAGLYVQPADASAAPQFWATIPAYTWDWSQDGDKVVHSAQRQGHSLDILMVTRSTSATADLVASPFSDDQPEIDPSGRYLAYQSDESGRFEIYVRTFPGGSGRWLVSTSGGILPRWSPRGGEIFFLEGEALMSVKVSAKETFGVAGRPEKLFANEAARPLKMRVMAPMPDGKRFLMARPVGNERGSIVLVENWQAESGRKNAQ
jgi:Tol biopolymer transport system component